MTKQHLSRIYVSALLVGACAIAPALASAAGSCPSSPAYSGQCTYTPSAMPASYNNGAMDACGIAFNNYTITAGQSANLAWNGGVYNDGFLGTYFYQGGYITGVSGVVPETGNTWINFPNAGAYTYTFTGTRLTYYSGYYVYSNFSCDATINVNAAPTPAPTCTVNVSPTSYNSPSSATVTWSSTNATTFYIANIGYVGGSGSSSVSPGSSTSYAGSVSGPGGSANCTGNQTLTVHPYCTFNSSTVTHGSSVTAYQASTVPYGSSCSSQTRTCSDGTLSGTYAYASCSVNPPANCTQDGVTINNGTSRTFYTTNTPPAGQLCSSGTYSQSRTCTNGVLSGTASYQYASCSCVAQTTYSCPDSSTIASTTITAACGSSTVNTTCTSPTFCSLGSSTCLNPTPSYNTSGTLTGHLQIRPQIVKSGSTAKVYWNVGNVNTCSVLGSNGDSWPNLTTSGPGGKTTSAISQATTYTLSCTKIDSTTFTETQSVTLTPVFLER